jgi:hypothetical protein
LKTVEAFLGNWVNTEIEAEGGSFDKKRGKKMPPFFLIKDVTFLALILSNEPTLHRLGSLSWSFQAVLRAFHDFLPDTDLV